jgi:hypothetical protein
LDLDVLKNIVDLVKKPESLIPFTRSNLNQVNHPGSLIHARQAGFPALRLFFS